MDRIALWAANSLKARPKVNEWMSPVIIRPVARRLTVRGINERPSSSGRRRTIYTTSWTSEKGMGSGWKRYRSGIIIITIISMATIDNVANPASHSSTVPPPTHHHYSCFK